MELDLQAILILDHAGLPLFFSKMGPRATNVEPSLIAGYLQAITSFGNEIFSKNGDQNTLVLDYGHHKICLEKGFNVSAVILTKIVTNETKNILHSILERFENRFCTTCFSGENLCVSCPKITREGTKFFDSFHYDLVSDPRILGWCLNWVPYFRNDSEFEGKIDISELIDGHSSLEVIFSKSLEKLKLAYTIFQAYNNGFLSFKNILRDNDIFILKDGLLLNQLLGEKPNQVNNQKEVNKFPILSDVLDENPPYRLIKRIFGKYIDIESILIKLIDHGAVLIAQSEHRKLILALTLVERCLLALQRQNNNYKEILNEILMEKDDAKLYLNIRRKSNGGIPTLNPIRMIINGLSVPEILYESERWSELAEAIVIKGSQYSKHRFIEQIVKEVEFLVESPFQPNDLQHVQKFSLTLEKAFMY